MQPLKDTTSLIEWALGAVAFLIAVLSLFLCLNGVEDKSDSNDHAAPKRRKRGFWKK